MLSLGQKIGSHKARVCSLIRQYQDLTWSGNAVDAYMAVHGLFRQSHKDVARSYDFIDTRNGFGAKCQSCNGLGTAHLINLSGTGQVCRD